MMNDYGKNLFMVLYGFILISLCNVNLLFAGSCGMSAVPSIPLGGCSEHYAPLAPWSNVVGRYNMDSSGIGLVTMCSRLCNIN